MIVSPDNTRSFLIIVVNLAQLLVSYVTTVRPSVRNVETSQVLYISTTHNNVLPTVLLHSMDNVQIILVHLVILDVLYVSVLPSTNVTAANPTEQTIITYNSVQHIV